MEKRPSLLTIDTTAVHLSSSAPAAPSPLEDAAPNHTPLSATRKRMSKVMKRLKKPNWNRRSRTASEALSEGHAASFSEFGSSYSSSLLGSSSCISAEDQKNSEQQVLSAKEEDTKTTSAAAEELKQNSSDSTAIVSNTQSTVSEILALQSETRVVLSHDKSTVAVKGDLDRWCKFL